MKYYLRNISLDTIRINGVTVDEFRSSRPEVFYKKDVLENFAKFTGKHLCQSLFLNRPVTLLKKRL